MRLLGHLVAADAWCHRLLLAVWLLVVVATAVVDGVRPMLAADPAVHSTIGILGSLVSLAKLLLMVVLVPLVLQTHPLVGSDAFWMTRPIPPRTLFMSKAVLLGVVVIAAPVFAEGVLMAAYDVPPWQIAAVAAETALFQAFWVVLLMTAAALTPNLARFALLCGGALVALALLLATMLAISMATMEDSPPMSGRGETGEPTSDLVLTVLAVVAGVALLVVQYRTRSRIRSVPVGAAALVLAFVAASAWPWPMLAPRLEVPAWAAGGSSLRLSASAETVQVNEESSPFSRRTAWRLARARVSLAGIEPGWSADVGVLEAAFHLDLRTSLTSAVSGYPAAVPIEGIDERPTSGVVRRLLGVQRLVESGPWRGESAIVFFLREADFRRFAPANGTYQGRFQVRLTHHDLEATLPPQHGATHQDGAYRLVVERVERTSASVSILVRESDATSLFDRRPTAERSFYLRNQQAGEAVAGNAYDPGEGFFLSRFLPFSFSASRISGFRARNLVIRFPPSYGVETESFSISDDWFERAELVVVRATREGSVERTLEIAGFPLRAGSESAASSLPGR